MSFQVYRAEKSRRKGLTLSLDRRLVWVFVACAIQMVYVPASNRVSGGIEPRLPIDTFPIWPIWVLPYVSCYILWFAGFVWTIFRAEDRQFRSLIAACIFTFGLGALTFIFFPTYVKPVYIEGNDAFTVLLRGFHEQLGRYAAFPSGHVYITTLLALFFARWYPRFIFLSMAILILVSLSTLLTGQHYILDVLGGYLVALAGYYFGLWWAGLCETPERTGRRPEERIPSSFLN